MRKATLCVALFALLVLAVMGPAQAAPLLLTFEGLQDLEPILSYYDGGLGGAGSGPGPSFGMTFSPSSLAIVDSDAGGSGNFGGEPSPETTLFFQTGTAILNRPAGFVNSVSFYYAAIYNPGYIAIYDGPNATGNVLANVSLPLTPTNGAPDPTGQWSPFLPFAVNFSGTGMSIDLGGVFSQIGFDDITLFTLDQGDLLIEKLVDTGGFGPALTDWEFWVEPENDEPFLVTIAGGGQALETLEAGTYTVTEVPKDGWTVDVTSSDPGAIFGLYSATVTVEPGGRVTVSFQNTLIPEPCSLTLPGLGALATLRRRRRHKAK